MAKLAILGFGTVGGGVQEVLRRNADGIARRLGEELAVKYVCDLRDYADTDAKALGLAPEVFVKDLGPVLADEEVRVVVETIGGTKPALDFVRRALAAGRHVVTSNKELVSKHGAELLALARQNGVCFLFEASVGGGTPLITPMYQSLAANRISSVAGIVNGTTNFMLTRMEHDGLNFDKALKEAQALGYAETIDPSSDVDGIDAGRKIAILASLAFGSHVYPQNVPTRGIRGIAPADMKAGSTLGRAVKLLAWANKPEGGRLACGVEPVLVSRQSQLAGVEDVFNAVMVEGDMLGEVVFYGKGAGRLPTASAVVADAIQALKEGVRIHDSLFWLPAEPIEGLYTDEEKHSYYLRAEKDADVGALWNLPGARPLESGAAVVVPQLTAQELAATLQHLRDRGSMPAMWMRLWDK